MESEDGTSEASTAQIEELKGSKVMNDTPCDCVTHNRLAAIRTDPDWRVEDLVRVPSSAHGYIDEKTGKQVGSYLTYIISFCVLSWGEFINMVRVGE